MPSQEPKGTSADTLPRLRVQLFGHLRAEDSRARNLLPRTRKTRALLAVVAMASPKPVLRLHLAGLLWSRREKEQARASLRQSVHELQDTLGPAWQHVFLTDRHHLTLRGAGLEVDVHTLLQPGQITTDLLDRCGEQLLEDLAGLDPAFDQWLEDERGRVGRIARSLGERMLAQCEEPVAAIEVAERLLRIDRRHEGAWRTMIRAHAERGDVGAALGSYERLVSALAEIPDARPAVETEELVARIRAQKSALPARPALPDAASAARVAASVTTLSGGNPAAAPSAPGAALAPATEAASDPSAKPGRAARPRDPSSVRVRVAPFRVIGNGSDDGFGVGLSEEISAGLSRFRWISCIPTPSWPTISGAPPAIGDAAEAEDAAGSNIDLLLEGTIQRAGARVRVIVRLVDLRVGGEIIWAGRFDREFADPLALQDELGATIVAQVDPELLRHEGRRSTGNHAQELTARDLLLQALPGIYRLERQSFLSARRLLERSVASDPSSSVAHGWLAYWYLLYVGQGWADDPEAATETAARLAERAVTLDASDARALTLAGHVRGFLGRRPKEACALHDRAIALNPNLALAWCFSGLAHSYIGQHEEALQRIRQAVRLSPSDPHGFFFDMALIMPLLMLGDYAGAVDAGRRAVELNPLFSSAYKGYLSALGMLGRLDEAAEALRKLLALEPGFSVRRALRRSPLLLADDMARYTQGLRLAGLPEGDPEPPLHESSVIDLALQATHSPDVGQLDSPTARRVRHETLF